MFGFFLALWIFQCEGVLVTQNECAMRIIIECKIYYTTQHCILYCLPFTLSSINTKLSYSLVCLLYTQVMYIGLL